jgi:hypothetical protein
MHITGSVRAAVRARPAASAASTTTETILVGVCCFLGAPTQRRAANQDTARCKLVHDVCLSMSASCLCCNAHSTPVFRVHKCGHARRSLTQTRAITSPSAQPSRLDPEPFSSSSENRSLRQHVTMRTASRSYVASLSNACFLRLGTALMTAVGRRGVCAGIKRILGMPADGPAIRNQR